MSPRVSVVVPVYNVAAYLPTCLESLAQQTMTDLEVIMVDDGSTDESVEIAERFTARDARFRLVRQANAGLGAARNTGVGHATGEFVAFVDSDDVVPHQAYGALIEVLDLTGSDFASGNVRRLTSSGTSQAGFLAQAFERRRLRTHISLFPSLLSDRTAWNKLFRRSFWDRHGLRFPVGVYYEDTPVTLPAHFLAKSVDVIPEPVYLWRMREGADLSITQRRTDPKTLRDRVAAVHHVSRFLGERRLNASKSRYDRTVVAQDLRFFLHVLPRADDEYRRLFLALANDFLDQADRHALDAPLAIDRLKWQLVRRRALAELLEVIRFEEEELGEREPLRGSRHLYGDYPYRTDTRLRIPARVYRLDRELALNARVDDLRWEGDKLRIEGCAHIELLGASQPDSQEVELHIRGPGRRLRQLRLRAEPVYRPELTADAAQQIVSLDWSGFRATLDGKHLKQGDRWREGRWECEIVVRAGGVTRMKRHFETPSLQARPFAHFVEARGERVEAGLSSGGTLTVRVQRNRLLVRSYFLDDGVLQLEGETGPVGADDLTLQVSSRGGLTTLEYPVYVDRSGKRAAFLARVPLEDIVRRVDIADSTGGPEDAADGIVWSLHVAGQGRPEGLLLDSEAPESRWAVNGRELAVQRTRFGNLVVVDQSFRPVVGDVKWSPPGTLLLGGSFGGAPGEYDLVVRSRRDGRTHAFPLLYDAEAGRFTADLTPASVDSLAGMRPLAAGVWELLVRPREGPGNASVNVAVDHDLLETLPISATVAHKRFSFGVSGHDSSLLRVRPDLDDDERGGFRQLRLRTSFYRAQRAREVRDVVLYDCFGGREYSDSPRAIHEELVRRSAPCEHLWVARDGSCRPPESAVPLRERSREYYEAFARARYLVSNDHWPKWFVRGSEQTCLQTWHGSPLKRHGYDLANCPAAVREYRRVLGQLRENWQYVVSAGAFATPILERAFPVDGEVVETGLPRTDLLLRPDRGLLAANVKRRLELPADKRIVLYAPTYRDHLAQGEAYRVGPLLDLAALCSALGDDYVVLFRKHPRVLGSPPMTSSSCVTDVSEFSDASELLLIADVLVTDYSSLMFDFAATGRPMIFFTPDLDAYRDEIRGFSIDFESVAPGPLLRTSDDVVEALGDPKALAADYREHRSAFVEKYCALDDGHAASRVVDHVFRW
jgi:CDP-glycerol glycerophosphotransferase